MALPLQVYNVFIHSYSSCQSKLESLILIIEGQFGIPKPWNFLFLRSYWFGESLSDVPLSIPPTNKEEGKSSCSTLQFSVFISNLTRMKILIM